MPSGNDYQAKNCRLLLYGEPKTKKTTWAIGSSLAAGFNVLILNGDNGISNSMLADIPSDHKDRLFIVDCADRKMYTAFVFVVSKLLKRAEINWDETDLRTIPIIQNLEHNYMIIDPGKLNERWVVIIDSYTKLVQSTVNRHAQDNNIDLSEAKNPDWDGYRMQGLYLDWVLAAMTEFTCHFIVIGHANEHEKKEKVRNDRGKTEMVSKPDGTWPLSSSRPHGKTIGGQFSDILFSYVGSDGSFFLDARNLPDRQGGCRNLQPGFYPIDGLSIANLIGYQWPDALVGDAVIIQKGSSGNGEKPQAAIVPDEIPVLNTPQQSSIDIGSLFKK